MILHVRESTRDLRAVAALGTQLRSSARYASICIGVVAAFGGCSEPFQATHATAAEIVISRSALDTMVVGEARTVNLLVQDSTGRQILGVVPEITSGNLGVVRVLPPGGGIDSVRLEAVAPGIAVLTTELPAGNGLLAAVRTDTVRVLAKWLDISAGASHTCGVLWSGTVACWGDNGWGQLGYREPMEGRRVPHPITSEALFKSVYVTSRNSCAIDRTSVLYCWGDNAFGQLGFAGIGGSRLLPFPVGTVATMRSASLELLSACAIDAAGYLHCWGLSTKDEWGGVITGTPCTADNVIGRCVVNPTPVRTDIRFEAFGLGVSHSCGLKADSRIECWGDSPYGQRGDSASLMIPRYKALTVGAYFNCVLDVSDTAWCWGLNTYSNLGRPANASDGTRCDGIPCSPHPVSVPGGRAYTSLSAGAFHACGVARDGAAWCWGSNTHGQLGGPVAGSDCVGGFCSAQPVRAGSDLRFAKISAGFQHSCGITVRGVAYCWGNNIIGQIGDGTTIDRHFPVLVGDPL